MYRWFGTDSVAVDFRDNFPTQNYEVRGPGGFSYTGIGTTGWRVYASNASAWAALSNQLTVAFRAVGVTGTNPQTGVAWTNWQGNTNYFPPPPTQTQSFSWEFGAEWSGKKVEVKDAQGNVLFTGFVPTGGGTVFGSVTAPTLQGARVFLDNYPAGALAIAAGASNAAAALGVGRAQYDLTFSPPYQNGQVEIRYPEITLPIIPNQNGQASGSVPNHVNQTAPIYASFDGGNTFFQTGASVQGTNRLSYTFTGPEPTPAPTPNLPTNSPPPVTTNAPSPAPTLGTNSVGAAPVSTNDVTVDVDTVAEIGSDDGEQGVLQQVTTMSEKFRQAIENFKGAFENVAMTFNEFRKFTLGGVGTNCTLNIGPVSLNLAGIVPDAVRSGMKLFILLVGVFAAIRYTWETFA